jgi:hypothetical protein
MDEKKPDQRPRPRSSLFWPAVLILIGVLFLMGNLNMLQYSGWNLIWRLWPVLLIIMGLDSLWDRSGVAGPLLAIGAGIVFLLSNFNVITWGAWDLVWRLWPVLIIAIGLDIAIGRRSIFGALLSLVLLLAVLGAALALMGTGAPTESRDINWIPEVEVTQVDARIKPAVGTLRIGAIVDSVAYLQGTLYLPRGENIDQSYSVQNGRGNVRLSTRSPSVFIPSFSNNHSGWNLDFSTETPLNLEVDMGVGQMDLDLSELRISSLDVNLGVGQTTVTLPVRDIEGKIEGGVGQMIIEVPRDAGVRIEVDNGLTAVSIPSDFDHQKDTYTSSNYNDAEVHIVLDLRQGIGSLVVIYK